MTKCLDWLQKHALGLAAILIAAGMALSGYTVFYNQDQRTAAILRNCQDQNDRHVATVRALDSIYARALLHANVAQRKQIAASRAPTLLIINALAPYRDCKQVLAKSGA